MLAGLATIVACVAISGAALHREFGSPRRTSEPSPGLDVVFKNAKALEQHGTRIGSADATVTIFVFSNFECPFCRRFHETARAAMVRYGDTVAMQFINFPLRNHRFAMPAARGAQCAKQQGVFDRFIDRTFDLQDSLGLKSWTSIAREAGVHDAIEFLRCQTAMRDSAILADRLVGESMGVTGTPTTIIGDRRLGGATDSARLDSAIASIVSKRRREAKVGR